MLSPQIFLCFTIFFSVVSAQSEGSCVGRCGQGYFRGDPCHCDYTCMTYMECCLDYKTVCTSEGSCQGRCHEGFIRGQTCDCDASCVSYGKCCPDYEEHCAKPVQKQPPPPPPPQLPDRDPSDDSPKPSRKPEERVPEPVPEDEIQKDEAVPKKGKQSLSINKKDHPKTSSKFSQSPPKKTTKRSPRRTWKKISRNLSTEEDDIEDPPRENQNSSPSSSKISRKRSPRRPAKKRYRKVIFPEEDEEDPFEGNAPASRTNKKYSKKDKTNPVYSTPKKPKKKKRRIIYEYEDESEDPNERPSPSKSKKYPKGKSPKNPRKKKSNTLVESEEETEDPKERPSSRLPAKGKKNPQRKSPKKKKSETLVESEEEIEESEDNVSSSSFSSSSSSSSVKGSKKTKKLSRKNQMKKKPQDEDDIPDPDNPGTNKKPKDKDDEPNKPKSPKTRKGDDDPDKPEIPPKEPNQRNPNDKGDKPKEPRGPTSKERVDDAEGPDKNPKEPNQRNPNDKGDKPKEPRGPTSKERGDDAEGPDKNPKEPNQRNPNDNGDKQKKPRGPTSKERGDDAEGPDKNPKEPYQRNPNDNGDKQKKNRGPTSKEREDDAEGPDKNPKEPNQRNPNDKGDKPKEPRGPTSKERGDDAERPDKNPKEPNQKNPNDKGDKLKEPRGTTSKERVDDGEGSDKNPKEPDLDDKDGKPKKPKVKNGDDPEDPDPLPKERLPTSPKDEDDKPQKTKTSKVIENTEETEQDEDNEENTSSSNLKNTRKRSPANANKRPKKPNSRQNTDDSPRKPLPSDKRKKNPTDNKPNKKKKVNPEDDADDESPKPGKGKKTKKKPSPKNTVKRKNKVDSEEERQETVSEFSSSSQSSSSHSRSKSIRRKTEKNKKNLKEKNKKKFPEEEEEPENPLMPPKKKYPLPTPVYTTSDEGSGEDGSGMNFLQTTIVSTTIRLNTTTNMATTVGTKNTEGTLKPSINPQTESINGSSYKTTTNIPIPESTGKQSAGSSATTVLYTQRSTQEEKTKELDTTMGTTLQQSKKNISIIVNGMDISATLLTGTPTATFNEESTKPAHNYDSTIEQQDMETKAKSTQDSFNNPVNMDMTTPYPGKNNGEKVEIDIGSTVSSETNSKVTTMTISPSHFDTNEKLNKEMITYSSTTKETTEQPSASTDQIMLLTSHLSNVVFSESIFKTTKNAYLSVASSATGSTEKAYSLHDEADTVNTIFPAGTAKEENINESKTTAPFSDKSTVSVDTTSASATQLAQTSIIMATNTNSKDSYNTSFTTEAKALSVTTETPQINQAVSTLHSTQAPLKDSTNTARSMDTTEKENIPQSTTVAEVTTIKEEHLPTTNDNRNNVGILTTTFTNLLYSTSPGEDKSVSNIFTIEQTSAKMDTIYTTLTKKQHSTRITLTEQTTTLSTPSLQPTKEQSTQQPPDTTLIKESSKPIKTVASTEKTEIPHTVTTSSAEKSSSASETSTLRQTPDTLHMTTDDLLIKKETNTEHLDIFSVTTEDKIKVWQTTDNTDKVSPASTIQENLTTLKEITESKHDNSVSGETVNELLPNSTSSTTSIESTTDKLQTTLQPKVETTKVSPVNEVTDVKEATTTFSQATLYTTLSVDHKTDLSTGESNDVTNAVSIAEIIKEQTDPAKPIGITTQQSAEKKGTVSHTTMHRLDLQTSQMQSTNLPLTPESETGVKPVTAEMFKITSLTTDISQKSILTSETSTSRQTVNLPETSQMPTTCHSGVSSTTAIDILKARLTTENINADQFPSTIQGKLLTSTEVTESEIINTVTPTAKISTKVPAEKEVTEREIYNTVKPTAKMSTEVQVEKEKVTENEIYNTVMPTTKMSTEVPVEKEVTESEMYNTVMPTTKMSTEVPVEKEVTENEIYNTVMPTTKMSTEVPVDKEQVTENEIYNTVMPTTKMSTEVPVEKEKVTENEIYNTVMPTTKMSTEVPVKKEEVTENEIYNKVTPTTKISTEVPAEKEVTENEIYNTITPTTKMSTEVPVDKEQVTENEIYNTVMHNTKMSTEVPVEKEVTENGIYNTVTPTTKMSTEVPVEKEKVTENEIYNTVMPTIKMSTEVPVKKEEVTENEIYNKVTPTTKISTEVPVEKEEVTENEIYNKVTPTTKMSIEVPVESSTIFVAKETATHNIDSIAVTKETSGMTSVKAKTEKQQTTLLPKEWNTQVTAVKGDDNATSAVTLFPVSYYTTLSDGHKTSLGTTGPNNSVLNAIDTADITKEQTVPPHKNPTQSIYITSTAPDNSLTTATTKRDILSTYHAEINEIASTENRHTPNTTTEYLSSEKQTTERGITNNYTTTRTTSLQTTENQGTQHATITIVNTVASEPVTTSPTEYKTSPHTVYTDLPIPNSTSIAARSSQTANIAETLCTTTSGSVRNETDSATFSLTTTDVPHIRPTTKNMNIDKESEENIATKISTAVPIISNIFMTASERANSIILTTETFMEDLSNFTSKIISSKATTGTDQIKSTILSGELSASVSTVTKVTTTAITSTNYHTTLSTDHKTSIGLVTEEANTLKDLDSTDITKEKATTPNISPIKHKQQTEKSIFNTSSLPTDDQISTVAIPISVISNTSFRSPDNDKQQTNSFSEKTQLEQTSIIMITDTNSKDSLNTPFTTEAKANALSITTENPQISQTVGTFHKTQTPLKESTNTPRSMDTPKKENIPQSTIKEEHLPTTDDNKNNVGILINTFTNLPYSTAPGEDKSVSNMFTIEQSSAKIDTMYATLTEKQHSTHITLTDQTTTLNTPSLQPTNEQSTQQPPDTTRITESSSKPIKTVASTEKTEIPHTVTTSSAQKSLSISETSTLRQTPVTLHMTTDDLLIKEETDAEHAYISSVTTIDKKKVWQTTDKHTSTVAIPISEISNITIRFPDNDTQQTTSFNEPKSRTPDTKSQGSSVAMKSMTAQSTHDLKATDADNKNIGITMIVAKETTVATENTSDSFTTVLDKDSMADQSSAMTRNPEIHFPVTTDAYKPLSTDPKSEGESVTSFTIKPSTAEVDKKSFSVTTTNTITPGSSAFKMLHKIQTTVETTDVSSHNILSVLPTMRPKDMSTGKTDAGDAQVTSESIESPSFPTKGHLSKIIFGIGTSRMSTTIKENVSGHSTFTTLQNTVSPKHSPYFHTVAVVSGITEVSGSSAQGLDKINTNQHANVNVTTTPSTIKSSVTKNKHMYDVIESGINHLHEPSFNLTVSTLKTPQDQSTADSNAKHTTPRLEGTAVTTPGLEGTAVQHKSTPMGPTKHTPESGLTTTLSHSSPGKDTGTSPKTQSIHRSTNKINEYSTTSALFSTRNPNESQSQTSTNPTTRHADDIINKVSAETTTTGQSVKLTTRQPGIDQTSKQPGQRPIPDGGSSYEATTKQSPNAKTTSIPRHTTTTSNHKDSFTTMPINEDDIETNKATTPHTIHPHHICNLLKDEAIRLRIPESDLKLITEICAEMQQQYPNVNIPSSLQTRQPNIDEKKIPPEYPLSEGTPNIWYQQPGSKMIQIIEEIYRRINTSPTTNLTGIPGQDNHRSTAWLLLINKIKRATDPQMNLCIGPPADGMTTLQNGSMVVFRGHYFWTLNQGGVTGMPRKISEVWGIPSPIDTVFTRCNCGGKTFFFKGPRYWRFTNDAMDKGYPKEIIKGFGGLGGKVTAVLSVAGIKTRPESVYFFKPGGNVQKYTFRQEQTKRCTKKKQPSLNYPIYSQKVQTVKFRFPRDIVRHRIEIRRTFTNIPQPLGILHEERSIRSTWRGIPNNIVSAVSLPNPQKQDGFDYFVFTKDKYYNINMSSKVAIKPPPEAEQKTTKDFYKCKE